jgi:hypothetical protein
VVHQEDGVVNPNSNHSRVEDGIQGQEEIGRVEEECLGMLEIFFLSIKDSIRGITEGIKVKAMPGVATPTLKADRVEVVKGICLRGCMVVE